MENSFDKRALDWDENIQRIELVEKIWTLLKEQIDFRTIGTVMDYGCGTGLLGYKIIDSVQSVTFCDNSPGMLEQVEKKRNYYGYQNVEILQTDLTTDELPAKKYDLILSMLVLHHITDIASLLKNFYMLLNDGGLFCWIDLDKEDGSFHANNPHIPHWGFSKQEIENILLQSDFKIKWYNKNKNLFRQKKTSTGIKEYPLFIAIAPKGTKTCTKGH